MKANHLILRKNLMARVLFALLTLVLAIFSVRADWSEPRAVLSTNHSAMDLQSIYRDPGNNGLHIVVGIGEGYLWVDFHPTAGVSANRTHRMHTAAGTYLSGVFRGAGDGRHLYLALSAPLDGVGINTAVLFESENSGVNWTNAQRVFLNDSVDRRLQDMIYVPETGRVFVFYVVPATGELRMVSRPRGSTVFSSESVVARGAGTVGRFVARAAFAQSGSKSLLHVVYLTEDHRLMYTQSSTNGVTWTPGKQLTVDKVASFYGPVAGKAVHIAYVLPGSSTVAKMIYSSDAGRSFSTPQTISTKPARSEPQFGEIAVCGTEILAGMFVTSTATVEYTQWTAKEGTKSLPHTFDMPRVQVAGADCVADAKTGNWTMMGFAVAGGEIESMLYVAANSG